MEKCSTPLVIRDTQIKNTMRYYYKPIRIAKIEKTDHTKCWQECGRTGMLIYCLWECKMVQPLWQPVLQLLKKLNIPILYDTPIQILSNYLRNIKVYVQRFVCKC